MKSKYAPKGTPRNKVHTPPVGQYAPATFRSMVVTHCGALPARERPRPNNLHTKRRLTSWEKDMHQRERPYLAQLRPLRKYIRYVTRTFGRVAVDTLIARVAGDLKVMERNALAALGKDVLYKMLLGILPMHKLLRKIFRAGCAQRKENFFTLVEYYPWMRGYTNKRVALHAWQVSVDEQPALMPMKKLTTTGPTKKGKPAK